MNKKSELGFYVAERRKTLALTQGDLAKALGYTAQGISKFESGDSQISILVLPKLANLLNESLDDLIAQKKNPDPLTEPNPQVDNANLVANLIAVRSQHNLSQEKEASLLGISKRSIVNYEQGEGYLPLDALDRLLKLYKISAKTFYFEKITPISVSQIHYENPKRKISTLWLSLAILSGVGLIVGCTSPLWLPKQQGKISTSSTDSASSTDSSATSSSANSVSSSLGGSSSPVIVSSDSGDGDLSPNIPGLKQLFVQTVDGRAGAAELQPGTTALDFFSGSFVFSQQNQSLYGFDFFLNNAPAGVTLTPDAGTYGQANLYIPNSVANQSSFEVGIEAYAVGKEDEKVKGAPLSISVFNSSGSADLSTDFPGLKAITLTIDGAQDNGSIKPGSHTLAVLSSPSAYFSDNATKVSLALMDSHDGVTLKGNTLTIESYVSNLTTSLFRITLTNASGEATYTDQNHKYSVDNPTGEPDSDHFPGLLSCDLAVNHKHDLALTPGDTAAQISIKTSSRFTLDLTPKNYSFLTAQDKQGTMPSVDIVSTGNDFTQAIIRVPPTIPDDTRLTIHISFLSLADLNNRFAFLSPLYLTISNSASTSSSNS
jgi:transcriptional regulator with XRE-family HTH domain